MPFEIVCKSFQAVKQQMRARDNQGRFPEAERKRKEPGDGKDNDDVGVQLPRTECLALLVFAEGVRLEVEIAQDMRQELPK